jgi:hypothetical protein
MLEYLKRANNIICFIRTWQIQYITNNVGLQGPVRINSPDIHPQFGKQSCEETRAWTDLKEAFALGSDTT